MNSKDAQSKDTVFPKPVGASNKAFCLDSKAYMRLDIYEIYWS